MKSWLIELEDGVPKGLEYDGTAKSDWTDAHFAYNRRQMKLTSFTVVVAAKPLHGPLDVRFVSIRTLIRMKELAGRPQDLIDIEYLKIRMDDDAGK